MSSSQTHPPLTNGQGRLQVAAVDGASACLGQGGRDPLRLLVPKARGRAVWCYTTSFGGGLVSGDHVDLAVDVGADATALLATQATTKVYHQDDRRAARQDLTASVAGRLVVLNDPVCCFADAHYRQRIHVDCAEGADLFLLDGVTAGRASRGEHWQGVTYHSELRLSRAGRVLVRDPVRIDPNVAPLSTLGAGRQWPCLATLAVTGGFARDHGEQLAATFRGRQDTDLMSAVVPLDGSDLLIRLAAREPRHIHDAVRDACGWLTDALDGDPWHRKF